MSDESGPPTPRGIPRARSDEPRLIREEAIRQVPPRDEFITVLASVLSLIRRAIETPIRVRGARSDASVVNALTQAVIEIERVAVPLRVHERNLTLAARQMLIEQALEDFRRLRENAALTRFLSVRVPLAGPNVPFDPRILQDRTVEGALAYLIERTEAELGLERGGQTELQFGDLRRIVPAQKVAPVQFEVRDGRIAILRTSRAGLPEDAANIANAKQALVDQGQKIISELERSNCDRRLLESVQQLQTLLEAEENVIRLGLANLACDVMNRQFQAELPDAVFAMVQAHTRGVEMFAAQFPDWSKFVENATATAIAESDIEYVAAAASDVVKALEGSPALAEPEVPKTILRLRELLVAPGASVKRAGFAMLRTLENLISRIFAHFVDLIDQTATNAIKTVSKTLATAVVVALLSMALDAANTISPVASKVPEMHWLRAATEVIRRELKNLEK